MWQAVRALQRARLDCDISIYTGDKESNEEILERTRNRFNLTLTGPVQFVRLKRRWLLEAKNYPRFTMLGQSLGSMVLAWEAVWLMTPVFTGVRVRGSLVIVVTMCIIISKPGNTFSSKYASNKMSEQGRKFLARFVAGQRI